MHETDIERTRRQVQRVADIAQEIADDAETLNESGFDPSSSNALLAQQQELVQELGQALADFNELTNRAETIETGTINYQPDGRDLSVTYDESANEAVIEYTGNVDIPVSEITVTKAGSETSVFTDTVTSGTTATVDTSGLADGDAVEVKVTTHRNTPEQVGIKSWREIIGSDAAPEISVQGIDLPEHNLVKETSTLTQSVVVGQTNTTQ